MSLLTRLLAAVIVAAGALVASGCKDNLSPRDNLSPKDNVSPKLEQQIDNQNGKIDRIESNQNAIKFAIEKRNENTNSGFQLFQGEGGLLLGFGVVAILCVTFFFYRRASKNDLMVSMLIEQIKSHNDPELEERVLKAALYTNVEKEVYHKMVRQEFRP